ncbi:hypothetical protein M0R72_17000 [Candidatus Pacearchaeota archaeon]|nr:hypothetical protein [Candidatus Pacearchaeota archaeon]
MSGKKGHCQTCDYIRSHRGGNRVNEDLVNGISISAIMQRTGLGRGTLTRHRDEGHMMAGFQKHAHLTVGAKEQLDLMRCAKEIYEDCRDNAAKAKGKAESSRDYRDASGCWDAATKALGILKPEDKPTINTNINLTAEDLDGKLKGLLDIIDEASSDRAGRSKDIKDG